MSDKAKIQENDIASLTRHLAQRYATHKQSDGNEEVIKLLANEIGKTKMLMMPPNPGSDGPTCTLSDGSVVTGVTQFTCEHVLHGVFNPKVPKPSPPVR